MITMAGEYLCSYEIHAVIWRIIGARQVAYSQVIWNNENNNMHDIKYDCLYKERKHKYSIMLEIGKSGKRVL